MRDRRRFARAAAAALTAGTVLSGCIGETLTRGYVPSESALQQVEVGASRDQVLIALGTPSTTADFNGEVFYYITQKTNRPVAFLNAHVIDQTVLAIYFDKNSQVEKIANYGLKDGKIIDFISRTTPTGGRDFSFVTQLFQATGIAPGALKNVKHGQ
jgi:outer membrane protein assembly factor BamE (lipoprotein component of BamABCDE complex)